MHCLVCVLSVIPGLQYFLMLMDICRCEFLFVVVWCGLVSLLCIWVLCLYGCWGLVCKYFSLLVYLGFLVCLLLRGMPRVITFFCFLVVLLGVISGLSW